MYVAVPLVGRKGKRWWIVLMPSLRKVFYTLLRGLRSYIVLVLPRFIFRYTSNHVSDSCKVLVRFVAQFILKA